MADVQKEYKPVSPKAHALLLEVYRGLMTAREEGDISVWAERFHALTKSFEALDDDGLLPPVFTKNFYRDVRDVARIVSEEFQTGDLDSRQGALSFGMGNLQHRFGAS